MRFAMRLLAVCGIVGTTASIARAEKLSDGEALVFVGALATFYLLPLIVLLTLAVALAGKGSARHLQRERKPSTTSERP